MSKRLTTQEFIDRVRDVHGDKYDYSKVEYVDAHTKVCIVCPKHGEFWQKPYVHLRGVGCVKCGFEKRSLNSILGINAFKERAQMVHGGKYDYSKVEYINNHTKVCIVCPKHGEFWQKPNDHLRGRGCRRCTGLHNLSTKDFVEKSKQIHGSKYDYSKVKYVNSHTKVCIVCPKHGEFWQKPNTHLQGKGCKKCQYESLSKRFTSKEFIPNARRVHGEKYDYSKVRYVDNKTKVCIICPIHGEFWQTPNHHLRGHGCPKCNKSHLETRVSDYLILKDINFVQGATKDMLCWIGKQHLDFYFPFYNIAIECQGEQHFVGWHKKKESLEYIKRLDARKKQLCKENGVKLHYINYDDDVETKLEKILKETCQNT